MAQVGTQQYTSLQAAVDAVPGGNVKTTVTLLDNIVMQTADIVTIAADKTIVLDMAGKSITVTDNFSGRAIVNEGTLTVTGNGVIDASMSQAYGLGAINNKGTLTIENGTFRGAIYAGIQTNAIASTSSAGSHRYFFKENPSCKNMKEQACGLLLYKHIKPICFAWECTQGTTRARGICRAVFLIEIYFIITQKHSHARE